MDRFLVFKKQAGAVAALEEDIDRNKMLGSLVAELLPIQNDLLAQQYKLKKNEELDPIPYQIAMTLLNPHMMSSGIVFDSHHINQQQPKYLSNIIKTITKENAEVDLVFTLVLCPQTMDILNRFSDLPKCKKLFVMGDPKKLKVNVLNESEKIKLFYGADGSGSIREPMNVDSFIRWSRQHTQWAPICLAVGCSPQNILIQTYMALMLLGNGSSLLLTIDNLFNPNFFCVISILSSLFLEVSVYKPESSHILMSDFYIIAHKLQTRDRKHRDILVELTKLTAQEDTNQVNQANLLSYKVSNHIYDQIFTCVSLFSKRQVTAAQDLNEVLQILKKNGISNPDILKTWHQQLMVKDHNYKIATGAAANH
jgi:hypothetical protein